MERTIRFHGGARAVGAAREAVLEHASGLPAPAVEDLQLLVSEVVTNAVRHGGAGEGTPLLLRVLDAPGVLRVEVTDHGPGFERTTPTPRIDGGWGLFFVDKLAARWDVDRASGRTLVWFEIDVSLQEGRIRSRAARPKGKAPRLAASA